METNTTDIGKVYQRVQRVDSTNNFLSRQLESRTPPEGLVVSAEEQVRGRGQYGRSWHSSPGLNILCSTVFYPEFLSTSQQFCLNMVVSNGLRAALAEHVPSVSVKWPNDLMAGERKIAGILIQCALQRGVFQHCIAGIGCNVNQESFPAFKRPAASIKMLTGESIDRQKLERSIFRKIGLQYDALRWGEEQKICTEYNRYLWKKGEEEHFELKGRGRCSARLLEVSSTGNLKMDIEGKIRSISSENIQYLR